MVKRLAVVAVSVGDRTQRHVECDWKGYWLTREQILSKRQLDRSLSMPPSPKNQHRRHSKSQRLHHPALPRRCQHKTFRTSRWIPRWSWDHKNAFKDATSLLVGPMSLDWPVNPFGRFDSSRSSLPPDVPSGEQQLRAFPASIHSRWRQDALQTQPQTLQRTTRWDGCGPFLSEGLRCITWNTRGLVGSEKGTENSNSNISKDSWTTTTSFVSRKCMERASFFRLSRCWLRDFDSLVPFYLTMRMRDRLSAFTGTFYLKKLLIHM